MLFIQIILAILACNPLVALAAPEALPKALGSHFTPEKPLTKFATVNKLYIGPWSNFPVMSKWAVFDGMFNTNRQAMIGAGSTQQDVQDKLEQLTKHIPVDRIRIAIISVAKTYGIDPRVLLGIIMEESHGVVGAKTTWNADGVPTGGLMQASSCHGYDGQKDLAQADITYMVDCGTQHFRKNLGNWGGQNTEQSIYPALREYNSGSVVASDLSIAPNGVGNPAYVNDLAQWFTG